VTDRRVTVFMSRDCDICPGGEILVEPSPAELALFLARRAA